MAPDHGAVRARSLGHDRQRDRPALRRGHASQLRLAAAASNPKANQTNGLLHLNFLDGVPILWIVVIFIALIGAVYYLMVGRTKAFAPVVTPFEDDSPLAGTGAAPPA